MASSLNKVMIIGNLGKDPVMRYTPDAKPILNFSVAVGRSWRAPGSEEWKQETEWFNVVVYERQAESLNERLAKGKKVYVEGRLKSSSWDDKDGQKRYRTDLIANQVLLLDARENGDSAHSADADSEMPVAPTADAVDIDDLFR